MIGAGGHKHRLALSTSAGDALPTAFAVETAKRVAARVCADAAAERVWNAPEAAKACIDMAPYVALAALAELCLDVRRERLARCLHLDPLDGVEALDALKGSGGWRPDLVELVVLAIGGGR